MMLWLSCAALKLIKHTNELVPDATYSNQAMLKLSRDWCKNQYCPSKGEIGDSS